MPKESAVTVTPREVNEYGRRKTKYNVSLKSDTFTIQASTTDAICSLQLDEQEAYDLAIEILCSMPEPRVEAFTKWMRES